jgi:hypothetical protein
MTCQRSRIRSKPKSEDTAPSSEESSIQAVPNKTLPVSSGHGPLKKRASFAVSTNSARPIPHRRISLPTQITELTKESLDAHLNVLSGPASTAAVSTVSSSSSGEQETLSDTSGDSTSSAPPFHQTPVPSGANDAPSMNSNTPAVPQTNTNGTTIPCMSTLLAAWVLAQQQANVGLLATVLAQAVTTSQPVIVPTPPSGPTPQQMKPDDAPAPRQPTMSRVSTVESGVKGTSCMASVSKTLEMIQDKDFIADVLKRRDEEERARVAHSMLYQFFVNALRQEHRTG